jgi:hypothetical protein
MPSLQNAACQSVGPQEDSFLRDIFEATKELNSRIVHQTQCVRMVADRAFGCEPEAPSEKRPEAVPVGLVQEIRDMTMRVGASLGQLDHEITRISKI